MVELKDWKGVEHLVVTMVAKKDVSWVVYKALTRVGMKVELKEGKGVDHWVVTMAVKKDVSWIV